MVYLTQLLNIFTLDVMIIGRRGLSDGAPCPGYINKDIPEITEILAQ
jgi:hypothetical protein